MCMFFWHRYLNCWSSFSATKSCLSFSFFSLNNLILSLILSFFSSIISYPASTRFKICILMFFSRVIVYSKCDLYPIQSPFIRLILPFSIWWYMLPANGSQFTVSFSLRELRSVTLPGKPHFSSRETADNDWLRQGLQKAPFIKVGTVLPYNLFSIALVLSSKSSTFSRKHISSLSSLILFSSLN